MGLTTDAKQSVCSSKDKTLLWENENLSQIPFKVIRGHSAGVTSCQFFSEGKYVLTSSKDGTIKVWNSVMGKNVKTIKSHSLPVTKSTVCGSNNNIVLSSSWDKTIRLWDLESEKMLWESLHEGLVTHCDISNDGNLAVSSSDFDNAIRIWDIRDGKIAHELIDYHDSMPMCCKFSPNSQRVASTGLDQATKIFDLVSKQTTVTLGGHKNVISSCCFSSNERYLCTTSWDKSLQIWDISTGMFRSQGSGHLTKGHDGSVSCCKFSHNGQQIVSGGYDNAIVLWEVQNKSKKLVLKGHGGWVNGVDISDDEKWVLSASEDSTVRVWNIEAADHIPAVIENRRAMGLKIVKCEQCGKAFSIAQAEDPLDIRHCVFCRLADPERNELPSL